MEYDLKARFYDLRLNVNQVNDIVFTMPRDPVMQLVWIGYSHHRNIGTAVLKIQ